MAGWERKWTDEQREAAALAYEDRKIRPYKRVAELAAAGELEHDGQRLEPYPMPAPTIRHEVMQLRRRRAGMIGSELATMPAADAIEALRRRLLNAADAELRAWERGKTGKRDMERHRQIARCVREAAAIPQPDKPRPVAPGQRDPATGEHNGDRTKGGLAAQIVKAHKAGGQPAHGRLTTHTHRDSSTAESSSSAVQTGEQQHAHGESGPGGAATERVDREPVPA